MLSLAIPQGPKNPLGLSATQIANLVSLQTGVGHISPRYSLTDSTTSLNPIAQSQSGLTGDVSDITRYIESAKISMNTTQAVHRSIDLTLHEIPGFKFNTLQHLLQVWLDYWDGNGNLQFEVPLGTFTFVLPDRELRDSGNVWTLKGLDLTTWVSQISFLNTWTVPAGTSYVQAVSQMLTTSFLPLSLGGTGQTPNSAQDAVGPSIPAGWLNITPCTQVTPAAIPYDRKTNLLVAVNDLLRAINYYDLFVDYDYMGRPVFSSGPMPFYGTNTPSTSWTYTTDATSIIQAGVQQQINNQSQIGNIAVVASGNAGNTAFSSIKYNNSPSSYISLSNWGHAVVIYVEDNQIPDQASCDLRAFLELQQAALASEQVQFSTAPNPFHGVHDYYLVNVASKDGLPEITSTATNAFEETQWDFDARSLTMTHTAGRMIPIG